MVYSSVASLGWLNDRDSQFRRKCGWQFHSFRRKEIEIQFCMLYQCWILFYVDATTAKHSEKENVINIVFYVILRPNRSLKRLFFPCHLMKCANLWYDEKHTINSKYTHNKNSSNLYSFTFLTAILCHMIVINMIHADEWSFWIEMGCNGEKIPKHPFYL